MSKNVKIEKFVTYLLLTKNGSTALTVSELLRKNQPGRGKNTPILGLNSFIIISGDRN